MPRRFRKKSDHHDEQIKRAKALALVSGGLVAELYQLHAGICEEKQKARQTRRRRKK